MRLGSQRVPQVPWVCEKKAPEPTTRTYEKAPAMSDAHPTPGPECAADRCPSAVYRGVLSGPELKDLKQGYISAVWSDETPAENDRAFVTGTYWCPLGDPKRVGLNGVERAIESVTKRLVARGGPTASLISRAVGAEWWFLEQGPEDVPKEFHTDVNIEFDPDEADEAKKATYRYPLMSSVFYLNPNTDPSKRHPHLACPTVVFGQAPVPVTDDIAHALQPAVPSRAVVCYPSHNQLLVFRGDLWHAVASPGPCFKAPPPPVPATPDNTESDAKKPQWENDTRYTLLINWWLKRPVGPEILPKSLHRARQARPDREQKVGPAKGGMHLVPLRVAQFDEKSGGFAKHAAEWRTQVVPNAIHRFSCPNCAAKGAVTAAAARPERMSTEAAPRTTPPRDQPVLVKYSCTRAAAVAGRARAKDAMWEWSDPDVDLMAKP